MRNWHGKTNTLGGRGDIFKHQVQQLNTLDFIYMDILFSNVLRIYSTLLKYNINNDCLTSLQSKHL